MQALGLNVDGSYPSGEENAATSWSAGEFAREETVAGSPPLQVAERVATNIFLMPWVWSNALSLKRRSGCEVRCLQRPLPNAAG